jgi:hypothetical protein
MYIVLYINLSIDEVCFLYNVNFLSVQYKNECCTQLFV